LIVKYVPWLGRLSPVIAVVVAVELLILICGAGASAFFVVRSRGKLSHDAEIVAWWFLFLLLQGILSVAGCGGLGGWMR
jgi:hypothetical protein